MFVGSIAGCARAIQGPELTTGLAQADIPREGRELERCRFGAVWLLGIWRFPQMVGTPIAGGSIMVPVKWMMTGGTPMT